MRAVVYDRYGPPRRASGRGAPHADSGPGQVLVQVLATSINLSDWECLRGVPLYARIGGVRAPPRRTLGSDIAGRVQTVGCDVTRFRVGEEVCGDYLVLKGGFAENAVAPGSVLAHNPETLTFAETSTLPQAGAIALQGTAGWGWGTERSSAAPAAAAERSRSSSPNAQART
jgi:NADPH:quinone reductase-like Zn-dependent oxidoreductase